MYINQTGNNEAVNYTTQYTSPNYLKDGKFLDLLNNMPGFWIKAVTDGSIYQGEADAAANSISGKPVIWPTTPEENGPILYDGAAALLYVSKQTSDVSQIIAGIQKIKSGHEQTIDSFFKLISG